MANTPTIDMNKLITDAENGDAQAQYTLSEMVFNGLEMTQIIPICITGLAK